MTVKERREYLSNFFQQAICLGELMAYKRLLPVSDRLKKKDVSTWCAVIGWKPEAIRCLAEKGLISEYRNGKGRNAAVYYSKAEISSALLKEQVMTGFSGKFEEMSLL